MAIPPIPIHAASDAYIKATLPPNAPPDQITIARRAFYAGVAFLLHMFHDYVGDGGTSEDDGQAYLTALDTECKLYFDAMRAAATPRDPREALGQMNYTTPDPEQIANRMREIGHNIGDALPPGYGFLLMIFNFGEGGSMFYISNGEREDMMKAMREFIQKQTQ